MRAFVVTADPDSVELASDALWQIGVSAVEERRAGEVVELWTSVGDDDAAIDAARTALRGWSARVVDVDESVAASWRRHAAATWIDERLVVRPAWVPLDPPPSAQVDVVSIEPGSTFGLGDHPTTVLTLRAMRAVITPGVAVLDVGCGSGVLSVVACRLGAAHATAIDIAPEAVPVTTANAISNGVSDRIAVSNAPLHLVEGSFDVVVANILAPVLVALAADLRRVLAPTGALIISGVLDGHHRHVEEALRPLRMVDRLTMDGWAALTLRSA
jgi:ribosomal protein L11 methyltransferase